MPRSERIALAVAAAATLALRAVAYFRYRFDSDEPQHLHVAWGWTAGLVQYRDVFDNHAPLFHMLSAPLLRILGERADILLWMRAPMVALWLIVSAATFVIARRFTSTRVAAWSVVLLNALPAFFLKSLEYRTDNLWNALWMLVLVVLTSGALTPGRLFAAGLLLGAAFTVSLKTMLLVVTLAIAGIVASRATPARIARAAIPALAGMAIAPAIIAAYFVKLGAWPNLVYCVFTFNELVARTREHLWIGRAVYVPLMAVAILVLLRAGRGAGRWPLFAVAGVIVFTVTLGCIWVLITPRDFLPILPILAIFAAAAPLPRAALAVAAAAMLASLLYYAEGFRNHTREHITMMNQVLHLTRPGEPLMDIKGETIYRRRPYYFIFEAITRAAMKKGLLPDTIPEDVIRERCYVAQADGPFLPPRGAQFLREYFVDLGRLRAAGQWIGGYGEFRIAIPGPYVIIDKNGEARGMLDGTPYTGARELGAGEHRFVAERPERLAVLWAPAFERGFSPLRHRDKDF